MLRRSRATSGCWHVSWAGIRWQAPRIRGGRPATPDLFVGAPWVVSVDDDVDPAVWTQVMHLALDCGAVVVPARSDEHDAAAATISHLPHLLAEALAVTAGRGPAGVRAGGRIVPRRHPRRGDRTGPGAGDVRGQLPPQLLPALDEALRLLDDARRRNWPTTSSVAEIVEAGHAARIRYDSFSRPQIVTIVIGAEGWRDELAAAGRAGGVIRSALPSLGSRG